MRELAEDRPRREAMGRTARQYVRQNHTWSGAADSYEEIIERAVAGRNRLRADETRRCRARGSSRRRSGSRPHRETRRTSDRGTARPTGSALDWFLSPILLGES